MKKNSSKIGGMIIDAHTHIRAEGSLKPPYAGGYRRHLLKLIAEARAGKVGRLAVIANYKKKDEQKNISTNSLVRLVAGTLNVYVIGSIDVLQYKKADILNLERLLKGQKIIGIKLYTGYQHFFPSDPRCAPIYRLCLKYGVPVVFHSGDTLAGEVKNPKIKYSHPIHIDEVAADFPELKIVISHLGNPWLIDCAEVLYKNKNVYADISGLVLGDDFGSDYGKLIRGRVRELLAYVGSNKLLYGTDWPLCPMKAYIKFAKSLGLSSADERKLFYENAEKVFGFDR